MSEREVGEVIAFFGMQPPEGWAYCDGGNHNGLNVPDLRDRMIMGAGDVFAERHEYGDKGNFSQSVSTNNHALTTAQMPSHSHEVDFFNYSEGDSRDSNNFMRRGSGSGERTGSEGGGQGHNHGSTEIDTTPPITALYYIIYVGVEPKNQAIEKNKIDLIAAKSSLVEAMRLITDLNRERAIFLEEARQSKGSSQFTFAYEGRREFLDNVKIKEISEAIKECIRHVNTVDEAKHLARILELEQTVTSRLGQYLRHKGISSEDKNNFYVKSAMHNLVELEMYCMNTFDYARINTIQPVLSPPLTIDSAKNALKSLKLKGEFWENEAQGIKKGCWPDSPLIVSGGESAEL